METLKAIVNLKTLYDNLQIIKSRTKAMIYAVVKANAYGHGMCVATFLQPYVDGFCVATFGEAEMLVGYAVYKPIIVLSEVSDGCQILPHENVVYSVGSESSAAIIRQVNPKAPFYIKVNSGMNRLGCDMEELPKIMNYVRHNNLNCLGASTHFFNSDSKECAEHQFKRFQTAIAEYKDLIPKTHCCASNALVLPENYHGDIIRVGLALYGYGSHKSLLPVMSVYAPIVKIRNVKKGEHIGYGSYKTDRDCRIAVVQIGYGDGYRRIIEGSRCVSVNGTRCAVVGQVCMDFCMADISNASAEVGDSECVIGEEMPAVELAEEYGTIVYEVLTSLGERVERRYVYK